MSKLLIDDYPIQVLPKLAKEIGLNEAIVLQQIHYWLNKRTHLKDGKYWTYGSMVTWQRDQFFFWSVNTVKRTFASLEKQNLLIIGNYNRAGFDKTKWYSVNYETLEQVSQRLTQNESTIDPMWVVGETQNETDNTLDLPKTSSDTKTSSSNELERAPIPYAEIIGYLNEKTSRAFRNVDSNKKYIKARWNEGYEVDDFKQVVDNKCDEWLLDEKMNQFLQPSTVFGPKFDQYLNQRVHKKNKKTIDEEMGGNDKYQQYLERKGLAAANNQQPTA